MILHVVTSPSVPPKEKDLGTVRKLLLKNINKILGMMMESEAADGFCRVWPRLFCKRLKKNSARSSPRRNAKRKFWTTPLSWPVWRLRAWGRSGFFALAQGRHVGFLCLSAPKFPVFNRWLRLVLTSALDEMTDSLNPPPLPVCFMLDELATLGHLQTVENAVGLSAGTGFSLSPSFRTWRKCVIFTKAGGPRLSATLAFAPSFPWMITNGALLVAIHGGRLFETTSQQQDIYGMTKGSPKARRCARFVRRNSL